MTGTEINLDSLDISRCSQLAIEAHRCDITRSVALSQAKMKLLYTLINIRIHTHNSVYGENVIIAMSNMEGKK